MGILRLNFFMEDGGVKDLSFYQLAPGFMDILLQYRVLHPDTLRGLVACLIFPPDDVFREFVFHACSQQPFCPTFADLEMRREGEEELYQFMVQERQPDL